MRERGVGFARMIEEEPYIIPVVHAESDYRMPLRIGEMATVHLRVAEVRRRKFELAFELRNSRDELACTIRTVHVAIDKQKARAIRLPEDVVAALTSEQEIV